MNDTIIQFVGSLLFYFVMTYVVFDFLNKMHPRTYTNKYIYICLYLACFGIMFAVSFAGFRLLNLLTFTVLTGVVGYFLYAGGAMGLLCNELFVLCLACCEEIAISVVSLFCTNYYSSNAKTSYRAFLNVALALIIIVCVYRIFIMLIKKIHIKQLSRLQYFFFFFFPVFSIIDIVTLTYFSVQSTLAIALTLITVIVLMAVNLLIAYLFEFISKSNELQNQLNLFQQQANIQYEYYSNLEEKYQQSRKLHHDILDHLHLLEKLYQSNEKQMAGQYAKSICEMVDALGQRYFSDNKALNIVINDKIHLAEANGISFECKIGNINTDFIAPIDLTTIFANLLDNAIDGCRKIDQRRFIKITAEPFHNFININISNSFAGDHIKDGDRYLSTKAAHEGIGIPNVIQKVEKYGGNLIIHTDQNTFTVNIVIPVIQNNS